MLHNMTAGDNSSASKDRPLSGVSSSLKPKAQELETSGQTTKAGFAPLYSSPSDYIFNKETKSSPLLATTPPTVSKALIRSYPYLLMADYCLGILTWTNNDVYLNLTLTGATVTLILYWEFIITFLGHILAVLVLFLYFLLIKRVRSEQEKKPTLDDIVQVLTKVSIKADLLVTPITTLNLTKYDLKRLLLTIVFLSPFYVVCTLYIFNPKTLLLLTVSNFLTYHSVYSRVTRRILWKSKTFRLLCFYATGLNFNKASQTGLFSNVMAKVKQTNNIHTLSHSNNGKPIKFTYVIYENQRKWLGIGWTSNLLNYERAPWTDEFMNESPPPDNFKLPDYTEDGEDLVWRWIDTNWKLDLTNDGALTLKNPKKNTKVDPASDDGYIYYDNTWRRPSSEDSFGKYTRRRRWLKTAELVHISKTEQALALSNGTFYLNDTFANSTLGPEVQKVVASGVKASDEEATVTNRRRSIRFDDKPTVFEGKKDEPETQEPENNLKDIPDEKENVSEISGEEIGVD